MASRPFRRICYCARSNGDLMYSLYMAGRRKIALELLADVRRLAEKIDLLGVPHTSQVIEKFR